MSGPVILNEEISSKQWKEFAESPVYEQVVDILQDRCEIVRSELEGGGEIDLEAIRFRQGELKGLRYLQKLTSGCTIILEEKEKVREERRKKDAS